MKTKATTSVSTDIKKGNQAGHVVSVTPELAAEWLSLNTKNRNIRPQRVALYASDMTSGHWQMTGEAVKFSRGGELLDGQHRLSAVVAADVPIQMMIVTGLDASTQTVMDSGAKRTAADSIGLRGASHAGMVAAAARLGVTYDLGILNRASMTLPAVSNSQIMAWLDFNPDIPILAPQLVGNNSRSYPGRSKGAALFTWNELRKIDADAADEFFRGILERVGSGAGDPMSALQRKFAQRRQWRSSTEAHLIFRTWNAVRAGRPVSQWKPPHAATIFADPR